MHSPFGGEQGGGFLTSVQELVGSGIKGEDHQNKINLVSPLINHNKLFIYFCK